MGTRINESLIKYLAGLLDADGSLSLRFRADPSGKPIYYVSLSMLLTASDEVDLHGFVAGLPVLTGMGGVARYGARNQFAQWNVSKRSDLEMLLPRLIKHMVIKAQHWQWLLDLWRKERSGSSWTCTAEEREALTEASKASRRNRVGPIHPKNHPTWAWVAGYMDGDGSYVMFTSKSKYPSRVTDKVTENTHLHMRICAVAHVNDASALLFLQKHFGGRIGRPHQAKQTVVWTRAMGKANAAFALQFLPNVAKHSRLKRHKIDRMIHHHQQRLSVPGAKAQATVYTAS